MGFFHSLNISASGLTAERFRLDVIANNIANANSTRTAEGGPYQRQRVVLMARDKTGWVQKSPFMPEALQKQVGDGVMVHKLEKDEDAPRMVYDPTHPDAIGTGKWEGYVMYPNVNVVKEMVNMIAANRSYEANTTMINNSRQMFERALSIGR